MNNYKINKYLDETITIIARARQGKINCNVALDILWELITNVQYEINHKKLNIECLN